MVYEDNYKPLGTAGASKFVSLDLVWVARRVQLSVIISENSPVCVFRIQAVLWGCLWTSAGLCVISKPATHEGRALTSTKEIEVSTDVHPYGYLSLGYCNCRP